MKRAMVILLIGFAASMHGTASVQAAAPAAAASSAVSTNGGNEWG